MYSTLWITFLMALAISLAVTPLAIKLAPRIGAVDIPKDNRRMHTKVMPRFGGLAIFAGSAISMLVFLRFDPKILIITAGGTMIYILGVIDDLRNLSPKIKFAGQLLVAIIMYMCDIRITFITNYFGPGNSDLGTALCFIITILWIVGITNTVNLIDGLDGLAAGTAAIVSLCIAYAAYIHGTYLAAGAMLALAGGALGFLPYNFYPAKIFMGDGGSLYLGFMLSTLSVLGTVKSATFVSMIIPVLVLGVPIFDTAFADLKKICEQKTYYGSRPGAPSPQADEPGIRTAARYFDAIRHNGHNGHSGRALQQRAVYGNSGAVGYNYDVSVYIPDGFPAQSSSDKRGRKR